MCMSAWIAGSTFKSWWNGGAQCRKMYKHDETCRKCSREKLRDGRETAVICSKYTSDEISSKTKTYKQFCTASCLGHSEKSWSRREALEQGALVSCSSIAEIQVIWLITRDVPLEGKGMILAKHAPCICCPPGIDMWRSLVQIFDTIWVWRMMKEMNSEYRESRASFSKLRHPWDSPRPPLRFYSWKEGLETAIC